MSEPLWRREWRERDGSLIGAVELDRADGGVGVFVLSIVAPCPDCPGGPASEAPTPAVLDQDEMLELAHAIIGAVIGA